MAPGGGYIAGASHDTILEETPVANVLAMFDAVRNTGFRSIEQALKGYGHTRSQSSEGNSVKYGF